MESNQAYDQARSDLNYLCSKFVIDLEELPLVGGILQWLECALVLLKDSVDGRIHMNRSENENTKIY